MSLLRRAVWGVPLAVVMSAVAATAMMLTATLMLSGWLGTLEQEWKQLDSEAAAARIGDAIDREFQLRNQSVLAAAEDGRLSAEDALLLTRPPISFYAVYALPQDTPTDALEPLATGEGYTPSHASAVRRALELREAAPFPGATVRGPWHLEWIDGVLLAAGIWEVEGGDRIAAVLPARPFLQSAVRFAAGDGVRSEVLVEGRIAAGPGIIPELQVAEITLPLAAGGPPLVLRVTAVPGPREALFPLLGTFILISGTGLSFALGALILGWGRAASQYYSVQHRQRLLQDRSPLLYAEVGSDLAIRDVNETLSEALEYDAEDLLGRSIAELVYNSPDLVSGLREPPGDLASFQAPATFITRDGGLRETSVTAVASEIAPGVFTWQLLAQDMTGEMRAHKASLQSRHEVQFLSKIVESFSDGLLVVDEQGGVFYANPAAREMLGDGGVLGRHLPDLFPMPPARDVWSEILEALAREQRWEEEFGLRSDESDTLRVSIRASGESPRRGGGRAVILLLHNLTRERELMSALATSQRQHEVIFNQAPTGIIVLDETGTVRDYNEFHRTRLLPLLAGTASEGFRPLYEQPALVRAGGQLAAERLYAGHSIVLEPVSVPTPAGETHILSIKGVPETDADGRVRHAYLFIEDITERHQRLVRESERASSLEDEKDRAVAASRLKSQFLATISHELRTPLNAIIGFSQIIARRSGRALDERQRANLARIEDSGQKLLHIVDDLLDVTRIETGRVDLRLETVDLRSFFERLQAEAEPLAEKNANTLQVVVPSNIGAMVTDAARLHQVLINLLGNAAKFTEAGQIILSAEAIAASSGSDIDSVLIGIEDSGIGIPEDQLSQIFEEFYQVDGSATRAYGGTGLGLAISRQLTLLLGGRISVDSQPGVGTTFVLRFPRQHPAAHGTGRPPRTSPASPSVPR